jgi:transcription elongation factor
LIWIDGQETAAPERGKKSPGYIGPKACAGDPAGWNWCHGLAAGADYNARIKIKATGRDL